MPFELSPELERKHKRTRLIMWAWNLLGAASVGALFTEWSWAAPVGAAGVFIVLALILRWAVSAIGVVIGFVKEFSNAAHEEQLAEALGVDGEFNSWKDLLNEVKEKNDDQ